MSNGHHTAIRLLRLRLHMVRDYEPLTVDLLVNIRYEVIELGGPAILHFLFAGFLTHLPREVAIDVNMLVRQRDTSLREKAICLWPILLLGIPTDKDRCVSRTNVCHVRRMSPHLFHRLAIIEHC